MPRWGQFTLSWTNTALHYGAPVDNELGRR